MHKRTIAHLLQPYTRSLLMHDIRLHIATAQKILCKIQYFPIEHSILSQKALIFQKITPWTKSRKSHKCTIPYWLQELYFFA